jgi:NitT/TauT family transport system substrate-binding protein
MNQFSNAYAEEYNLKFGSTANLGVLPLIAKNEDIFGKQGLAVKYKKFQTGKMTMDALVSGDIEAGTIVDSNVSFINYTSNPIRVIASIATRNDDAIYYDITKNISSPKDLVGKRIGYAPATTSHIFLAKFLEVNDIKWSEVKPIILQPPAMESALRNGAVDAVSIWQPWGVNILKQDSSKFGVFSNSAELYPSRILLATTEDVIKNKTTELLKLLGSLEQALLIYTTRAASTYSYLAPEIGASVGELPDVLKGFHFSIEVGSVVRALVEDIGKWISISQENFKGRKVPTYGGIFYDKLLSGNSHSK